MQNSSMNRDVNHSHEFVNREDVLKRLKYDRKAVSSGKAKCVFLKGETGVGKTRIAEEFLAQCRDKNYKIFRGRCLYYEGTEPYLPFYEGLGDYLENEGKEKVEEKEIAGPAFISQPSSSRSSGSTGERSTPMSFMASDGEEEDINEDISFSDQQDMMFNRITEILKDISKKQPVIFFIDDLQWIDESSAQLLHHVARNISENKIFLLGAFRPEELRYEEENPPLEDTLTRMKEEKVVEIVEIPRLDQPSVSELVKKYLKQDDLSEDFTWSIYRESEGNPFYVIEILNSMMQEGMIDLNSDQWDPEKQLSDITIPSSIQEITSRKIEKLDKQEKNVLMIASVLGTEFDFQLLERVVDIEVIELLDIIDSLEGQGLIQEVTDSEEELYRFHHLQTKTVIYEKMGKSRKRITHQRVGEMLEKFYEDEELDEHLFDLSRHFFEGKEYGKAFEYSKKAGERALQGLDISTAINYFEQALESFQKAEDLGEEEYREFELFKRMGKLYFDINDWESAIDIYTKMIRRGRDSKDKKMESMGLIRLGYVYKEFGEYEKAEGYFEQALKLCEGSQDLEGLAQSNRGLGYVQWREGELEKAKDHYRKGVEISKQADDDKELALNYLHLAMVYGHQGDHDKAIEFFEKSLPPLEARNLYRQLARVNNNIGDQYMKKEEWKKAIEHFDNCIEHAKKINNKKYIGWGSFNAAEAYTSLGNTSKASEYIEEMEELMKEIDDDLGLAAVYHVKGMIHEEEGDIDKAIDLYKKAVDITEELEVPFNRAEYTFDLGMVYKRREKYKKARTYLEKAEELLEGIEGADKFIRKARKALDGLDGEK